MIRFKVIRASRILLAATIIMLAAVVILLVINSGIFKTNINSTASLVYEDTAKTISVFAVSSDSEIVESSDRDHQEPGLSFEVISSQRKYEGDSGPRVFIYHTHSRESYTKDPHDLYIETETWRTTDQSYNVIRVGEELANQLSEKGFDVTHNTTDHEQSDLATAYERSLLTLEALDEKYDVYIDLHRDAYSNGLQMNHIDARGLASAQIMLLIGNGEGFEIKPAYAENRVFAKKLTQRINSTVPGICRDVLVKDGRYNQHIGIFSVLVEIGHNLNTLEEALNAVPALAEGLYDLLIKEPDLQISAIMNEMGR